MADEEPALVLSTAADSSERRIALARLNASSASRWARIKALLSTVFQRAEPKLALSSSTTKLRMLTTSEDVSTDICDERGMVLTETGIVMTGWLSERSKIFAGLVDVIVKVENVVVSGKNSNA